MTPDRSQEDPTMAQSPTPSAPTGGPATPPRIAPWLLLYTLGRLVIAVALITLIWLVGLPGFPALLFGLLLSMPVAYFALRRSREQLSVALVVRAEEKRRAKEQLRARLSGEAAA